MQRMRNVYLAILPLQLFEQSDIFPLLFLEGLDVPAQMLANFGDGFLRVFRHYPALVALRRPLAAMFPIVNVQAATK